jgi:hypothetical protein
MLHDFLFLSPWIAGIFFRNFQHPPPPPPPPPQKVKWSAPYIPEIFRINPIFQYDNKPLLRKIGYIQNGEECE